MAERQYPSNSDASRAVPSVANVPQTSAPPANPKNITPVVSGAQKLEKGVLDKASDFLGINKPKTFGDWVQTVADITNRVYSAFDTITGNKRIPQQSNQVVPGARIAYGQFWQNAQVQQQATQQRGPATYWYDDILYPTRGDAEVVLAQMRELLELYKNVSVGDMFDLSGISSPNGYVDQKYGWRDLSMARTVPVGTQGYMIVLPRATQL